MLHSNLVLVVGPAVGLGVQLARPAKAPRGCSAAAVDLAQRDPVVPAVPDPDSTSEFHSPAPAGRSAPGSPLADRVQRNQRGLHLSFPTHLALGLLLVALHPTNGVAPLHIVWSRNIHLHPYCQST